MSKERDKVIQSARKWLEKQAGKGAETKPVSTAVSDLELLVGERAKLKALLDKNGEESKQLASKLAETLKSLKKTARAATGGEKHKNATPKTPAKSPVKPAGKPKI